MPYTRKYFAKSLPYRTIRKEAIINKIPIMKQMLLLFHVSYLSMFKNIVK